MPEINFDADGTFAPKAEEQASEQWVVPQPYEEEMLPQADYAAYTEYTTEPAETAAPLQDANSIEVTIADKSTPILVFFGPTGCGKTMTLIRLARFLRKEGYTISPIRSFRPDTDLHYGQMCDGFNQLLNQFDAAQGTNLISFMLVEVLKNGRRLCQILEAPGEYYFNPDTPSAPFPAYVHTIINSPNRKFWCVMLEPDWKNDNDRRNYVDCIKKLKSKIRTRDKVIFLLNKIDKTYFVKSPGVVNMALAKKEIANLYPNLFEMFRNTHPISRFWHAYYCEFTAFQTGDFSSSAATGRTTYQEGVDEYPRALWKRITKYVKG